MKAKIKCDLVEDEDNFFKKRYCFLLFLSLYINKTETSIGVHG